MPINEIINLIEKNGFLNFESEMLSLFNMLVNLRSILSKIPSVQSDIRLYNKIIDLYASKEDGYIGNQTKRRNSMAL